MISSVEGFTDAATSLAELQEGDTPQGAPARAATQRLFGADAGFDPFNVLQYNAVMCNDGTGSHNANEIWADVQRRVQTDPVSGYRADTALFCGSWPWVAKPWQLTPGHSPLQLSGHLQEDTTPYVWAVAMHKQVGGGLLTIDDDVHGSLPDLPCAQQAIDFFHTRRTQNGACR